eukprot:IDg2268t1
MLIRSGCFNESTRIGIYRCHLIDRSSGFLVCGARDKPSSGTLLESLKSESKRTYVTFRIGRASPALSFGRRHRYHRGILRVCKSSARQMKALQTNGISCEATGIEKRRSFLLI